MTPAGYEADSDLISRRNYILYADLATDGRMWVVVLEPEVVIFEIEDALHFRIDMHLRQRARFAAELQTDLIKMIEIDVGVSGSMDKFSGTQSAHLRHHHA